MQSSTSFILFKTDVVVKGFCLVQAELKWAFWAEKRELLLLRHFKSKKQNNIINQCLNHFLTSDEMPGQKYFLGT